MKSPSAPTPPDPKATAAAQTGTNVGTAVANQTLGMVNQKTPQGNLTYNQTGSKDWTDPANGQVYQLPQYTATQTLSPDQAKLDWLQTGAEQNMARLAKNQSERLGGILGKPLDMSGAPKVSQPNLANVGAGPNLQNSIAGSGSIQSDIAGGGDIQNRIASGGNIQSGFGGAGDITRSYGTDFSKDRARVERALMSRMNPSLEQERSRLSTQLSNQGIKGGTEAYDREMQNFGQRSNDARMGAILAGGQEQSRLTGLEAGRAGFENSAQQQAYGQQLGRGTFANEAQGQRFGQNAAQAAFGNQAQGQQFGQNAAQAAFGNQAQGQRFDQNTQRATFGNDAAQQEYANALARTQANNGMAQQQFGNQQSMRSNFLNEGYAARNQPVNEIAALLGTGQVQQPQFANTPQTAMPNVDYAGLVNANYGQQQQNWQQQNAQRQSLMGGLFGLGASGIMASDRRLKTDIKQIGMWRDLPVYLFRYIWGGPMQIGVMAQDMLKLRPHAVVRIGEYYAVDYGRLAA